MDFVENIHSIFTENAANLIMIWELSTEHICVIFDKNNVCLIELSRLFVCYVSHYKQYAIIADLFVCVLSAENYWWPHMRFVCINLILILVVKVYLSPMMQFKLWDLYSIRRIVCFGSFIKWFYCNKKKWKDTKFANNQVISQSFLQKDVNRSE